MGKELAKEWLKASNDDLSVIAKIIDDANLTHIVAFHSQQAIEKSLKAMLEFDNKKVLKVHKLQTIVDSVNLDLEIDDTILQLLDKLYIDSRYPGNFGLLPYGKPLLKDSEVFYQLAKDIFNYTQNYIKDTYEHS
ncbi:MAG: HEPN domain-containing protein [Campylobacterales bacterium]